MHKTVSAARTALLCTALAVTVVSALTACDSYDQPAPVDDTAVESPAVAQPAEPAPVQPPTPDGFTDDGTGLAIRMDQAQCSTAIGGCAQAVSVYAFADCPNNVYLEANVINTSGDVIGFVNDSVGSLAQGQTWHATLTVLVSMTGADKVTITKTACN